MVSKGDILYDIDPIDAKTQLTKRKSSITDKIFTFKGRSFRSIPSFSDTLLTSAPKLYPQS